MIKLKYGVVVFSLIATPLLAQDQGNGPREILNSHRVSEPVTVCINDLTKNCILSASLNTVMDESLAVERIKVLAALSQSLVDTGEYERAKQSLEIAIADLNDIRFEFVKRIKRVEIAPVQAQLGEIDEAIAMLSPFRGLDREKAIEASMHAAAKMGNVDGVLKLSKTFTMYKNRVSDFLLDSAETMLVFNHVESAKMLAETIRDNQAIMESASALVRLAYVFKRVGNDVAAEALYNFAKTIEMDTYNMYEKFRVRLERVVYHAGSDDAVAQAAALEEFSVSQKELGTEADRRDLP